MREIRQSGSEGGGSRTQSVLPTPIVSFGPIHAFPWVVPTPVARAFLPGVPFNIPHGIVFRAKAGLHFNRPFWHDGQDCLTVCKTECSLETSAGQECPGYG